MGSLQIVLFPSNYLQMAIRRAGNITNIWHLPREFSPLVIAECNPPLQAEKTFFSTLSLVLRAAQSSSGFFLMWRLNSVLFSFSLLHVLTSNSCTYCLNPPPPPALPSVCVQDCCMAFTSCATLTVYRSTLLKVGTCSHSSNFTQMPPFSSQAAAKIVATS